MSQHPVQPWADVIPTRMCVTKIDAIDRHGDGALLLVKVQSVKPVKPLTRKSGFDLS